MDYRIVLDNDVAELVKRVNDYIAEGWQPQGGIAVVNYGDDNYGYYQAMVRQRFGAAPSAEVPAHLAAVN